jgi:cell division protein FtsX
MMASPTHTRTRAQHPPGPFPSAVAALRRHPAPTVLAVIVLATSLLAVGTFALALEQAAMLEAWYRARLPARHLVAQGGVAADLLPLLGWGRLALAVAAGGAILALVLAGRLGMRMTAATRGDEVRAAGAEPKGGAWVRRTLLAQATLTGLAGAGLAAAVLVAGVRLVLRAPRQAAALEGMPLIGGGELLAVLPAMAVAGVLACGIGGLLAQRALLRA